MQPLFACVHIWVSLQGLCKTGVVHGTVCIVGTREITGEVAKYKDKHCINEAAVYQSYSRVWAWELASPHTFKVKPTYTSRARKWVGLSGASSESMKQTPGSAFDEVSSCASNDELNALADTWEIKKHGGHKVFRVVDSDMEITHAFKFGSTFSSRQTALVDARQFQLRLRMLCEQVEKMKKSVLVENLAAAGLNVYIYIYTC